MGKGLLLFCAISLGLSSPTYAQNTKGGKGRTATSSAKKKTPPSFRSFRIGTAIWQEAIDLQKEDAQAKMESQLIGILGGYNLFVPFGGPRWVQSYGVDFGLGTLKGKGNSDSVSDELKNQPWIILGLNFGLIYRTSSVSEIGVGLPVYYRLIQWKLDPAAGLNPDRDTSFSAGISGIYNLRFSKTSVLNISMTRQHMWNSTVWGIAYQRDLR